MMVRTLRSTSMSRVSALTPGLISPFGQGPIDAVPVSAGWLPDGDLERDDQGNLRAEVDGDLIRIGSLQMHYGPEGLRRMRVSF